MLLPRFSITGIDRAIVVKAELKLLPSPWKPHAAKLRHGFGRRGQEQQKGKFHPVEEGKKHFMGEKCIIAMKKASSIIKRIGLPM